MTHTQRRQYDVILNNEMVSKNEEEVELCGTDTNASSTSSSSFGIATLRHLPHLPPPSSSLVIQMFHMPPLPHLMPMQMHSNTEGVREGREWYDVDAHASPLSSFSSNIDIDVSSLYLLFLLIIDVRIDIGKADHHIVLANYRHNSHPRCYRLSPPLKLSFCPSFFYHPCTCCIFYY